MNIERGSDLIIEFQRGSQQAFKHIYYLHKFELYKFVYSLILDRPEAHDLVADCYIKLWNRRTAFEDVSKVKAFLFVTAHNACINHLKHQQVQNKSRKELLFLLEKNEDFVETKLIKAELIGQIYTEIENLPSQCRKIFKMIYFKEMSYEEVAHQLNLSQSTVRNQKKRALELLRGVIFDNKSLISIFMFFYYSGY